MRVKENSRRILRADEDGGGPAGPGVRLVLRVGEEGDLVGLRGAEIVDAGDDASRRHRPRIVPPTSSARERTVCTVTSSGSSSGAGERLIT